MGIWVNEGRNRHIFCGEERESCMNIASLDGPDNTDDIAIYRYLRLCQSKVHQCQFRLSLSYPFHINLCHSFSIASPLSCQNVWHFLTQVLHRPRSKSIMRTMERYSMKWIYTRKPKEKERSKPVVLRHEQGCFHVSVKTL